MLRLLADENFDGRVVQALRHRSALDLVRVQEIGLRQADDPTILARVAAEGRVLLTHDARTLVGFAHERVRTGLPMPGVVLVRQEPPVGRTAAAILALALSADEGELEGQVRYLPG